MVIWERGSKGSSISNLQKQLNQLYGYNLAVDGSFGSATQAAVKDAQKRLGVAVDGRVGDQTRAALQKALAGKTTATAPKVPAAAVPSYEQNAPTMKASQGTSDALKMLQQHQANQPGDYAMPYADKIAAMLDQIQNREKFGYDFNADPLYQQYKDNYMRLGNVAMRDTMGNAAALSGGYGSSYATTAGSQAYQGYLSQLNDVIPELYSAALDKYQGDTQQLNDQLGILMQLDQTEYGRYRDDVNDYMEFLNYYAGRYDTERNFDMQKFAQEWDTWNQNRSYGYQKDQDALQQQNYLKELALEQAQFEETKRANAASEKQAAASLAAQQAAAAASKASGSAGLTSSTMTSALKTLNDGARSDEEIAEALVNAFGDESNFDTLAKQTFLPGGRTLYAVLLAMTGGGSGGSSSSTSEKGSSSTKSSSKK